MVKRSAPLDPYGRSTLRAVLLPPDGYRLEHALGTAYSLDAETLVTIPLFAAGIGADELVKSVGISRIYELGTRLTLLVQGDRIAISKHWASSRPLLGLVGQAVVPCSIEKGSFHPKLLALQFVSIDHPNKTLFRIVIATRNLTTDNSWDSVVVLDQASDGVLIPGLADAIGGLAQFVNDSTHAAVGRCQLFANLLKSVRFQPLPGITDLEIRLFHPGSTNAIDVFKKIKGDDLLIISPFVRHGFLNKLAASAGASKENRWLVTRPVDVPKDTFKHYQIFQIADAAVPVRDDTDSYAVQGRLVGLHAKIYLASSRKGETRLVVTSANATPSGWLHNVEVAVTGVAKSKALQVPSLLAASKPNQERTFRSLLEEITPGGVETTPPDPEWVKTARSILASAVVVGNVEKGPPRTLNISLKLFADIGDWPEGVRIFMRPFGYENNSAALLLDASCMLGCLKIDPGIELTPFVALTLESDNDPPLEIVLAMRLEGDLDWDRDAALRSLAQSAREDLYLELLWYFGVRGAPRNSHDDPGIKPQIKSRKRAVQLPILEKILLRVHGPNAKAEIAVIDGLMAGLTNDAEDEKLSAMWRLVKASFK